MKKLVLLSVLLTTLVFSAQADYDDLYTFEQGTNLVGVNVGLGSNNTTAFSAFYEYGLSKLFVDECTLGGGIFGGYYHSKLGKETLNRYILGVKANIHYQFIDRLDTYAGIAPNFNIRSYKQDKDKAKFACYFHVGGRYYLTNWLGVFAEISTGFNNFSGGLSIKF
jgi:hypothetical protein